LRLKLKENFKIAKRKNFVGANCNLHWQFSFYFKFTHKKQFFLHGTASAKEHCEFCENKKLKI